MAKVKRLLEQIIPIRYTLGIDVDMTDYGFVVDELLEFELSQATHQLVLHAVRLDVSKVVLDGATPATNISFDQKDQTVTFSFDEEIREGVHTLSMRVGGQLNNSLRGFYRSTYKYEGTDHSLATTQFEAAHAREAFVAIDEPSTKAIFDLNLTIPCDLIALSNTNVVREETVDEKRKKVVFASTPKMSTYLLAYIVGKFEYLEKSTPEGVAVRAYATPGQTSQLEFALDTAAKTLSYFTDYFGIPYPLPKLDMVAIPDFAAGAMENWGLVTYRDTALLLDTTKTSLSNKQRVAEVVMHELAHQWFGNLVTMAWWDDLWLNEGFATWVETLAMDRLFPQWHPWEEFANNNVSYAMQLDGLANTHPIQVAVDDPRSLDEIFDAISYSKGASVIDMLHHFLGAEAFQKGLHDYLLRHQYGNAVTSDLWAALGEASKKPVNEVMSAWTSRPGFPIISFEDGLMKQERFYSSKREAAKVAGDASDWPLPFAALLPNGAQTHSKLVGAQAQIDDEIMSADWFKPNPGQTGFFRTKYTQAMIKALSEPLRDKSLSAKDRFGIVDDVFAVTEAGGTSSEVALDLAIMLREESDYLVWNALAGGFGRLIAIIDDPDIRIKIEKLGNWLVAPNVARLGWNKNVDETAFDTLLRPLVLQQAVRFDDENVTAEARRRFELYLNGEDQDPDLRGVALYAAARHGTEKEFNAILDRYRSESSPQVKMSLLASLGRFRQPQLIDRFLKLGISKDVRAQDLFMVLAWGFRSREGRDATWEFMKQHWELFLDRYGDGGHMLERFPMYAASGFSSLDMAKQIEEFFAAHPHPAITRPVKQAVESVLIKADWYNRDKTQIASYLASWRAS